MERAAISTPDDRDLVLAAQSGDRSAFEQLSRRWWPSIRRWALAELADPVRADDAAQDAVVRLIRHIGSVDPDRPFGPWLHTLVRNTCRDRARRRWFQRALPWTERPHRPRPERELDVHGKAALVLSAMQTLPSRQRHVLELCERQGLTPAEAAPYLDLNANACRALLHRARTGLRAALEPHRDDVVDLLRDP